MVAVPCDRTLDDLPVHSGIACELILTRPLLKIEEIAEELEGFVLTQ
jgi:hypothetical protein